MGCLAGALVGAPEIGLLAAVAITPLASLTRDPTSGAVLAAAAAWHGAAIAHCGDTPGIIVPPFLGAMWGGIALAALLFLPERRKPYAAGLAALAITAAPWLGSPSASMVALGPWIAGALFVSGLGVLAGQGKRQEGAARLATVVALLLVNIAAQGGLVGLLLGPALHGRLPDRVVRVTIAFGALGAALWMGWIPHQLDGWPSPGIPLPSGFVPVTAPAWALVLPLFAVAAVVASLRGSRS